MEHKINNSKLSDSFEEPIPLDTYKNFNIELLKDFEPLEENLSNEILTSLEKLDTIDEKIKNTNKKPLMKREKIISTIYLGDGFDHLDSSVSSQNNLRNEIKGSFGITAENDIEVTSEYESKKSSANNLAIVSPSIQKKYIFGKKRQYQHQEIKPFLEIRRR